MSIVKAGLYSVVAAAAKLLSGLAVVKVVAWFSGPEGMAKLGQFLNLTSLATVFAGGGITAGVVKYVAETKESPRELARVLQAATGYTLAFAVFLSVLLIPFSGKLAEWLLGDHEYRQLMFLVAIIQPFIAIHTFILATINGFMDVKRVALINIFGAIFGVVLTAVLSKYYGLSGALYSLVIGQALLLAISVPMIRRTLWFNAVYFRPRIDVQKYKLLAQYSVMSLTSALLTPIVGISVRNHLASKFSWEAAGQWQSVSKVSEAYLLCVITVISVYHLPKLASIREGNALLREIKTAYLYILPPVTLMAIFIYVFRDLITVLLFSDQFLHATSLYGPQLVGDILKTASFILSYMMLAKKMTTLFIASEITFSFIYVILVFFMTAQFGLIGAMYAFCLNYLLYFFFNVVMVKKFIFEMNNGYAKS